MYLCVVLAVCLVEFSRLSRNPMIKIDPELCLWAYCSVTMLCYVQLLCYNVSLFIQASMNQLMVFL